MISAKEAKALVESSEERVLQVMKMLGGQIEYRAMRGQQEYLYSFGDKEVLGGLPEMNNEVKAVVNKLIAEGYKVNYCFHGERYVPRGLSDDDGNGPEHSQYGVLIKW